VRRLLIETQNAYDLVDGLDWMTTHQNMSALVFWKSVMKYDCHSACGIFVGEGSKSSPPHSLEVCDTVHCLRIEMQNDSHLVDGLDWMTTHQNMPARVFWNSEMKYDCHSACGIFVGEGSKSSPPKSLEVCDTVQPLLIETQNACDLVDGLDWMTTYQNMPAPVFWNSVMTYDCHSACGIFVGQGSKSTAPQSLEACDTVQPLLIEMQNASDLVDGLDWITTHKNTPALVFSNSVMKYDCHLACGIFVGEGSKSSPPHSLEACDTVHCLLIET